MKKIFILTLASFLFFGGYAQKCVNKMIYDKNVKQKILIGQITREGLQKKQFKNWFDEGYKSYTPNQDVVEQLINFVPKNAKIVVIMGTWCSDSRREVPRLFKILDAIGFNKDSVTIYAINRKFSAGKVDISAYNAKKVPTIIYYHYGYEAGRIIETPEKSLEEDLLLFSKRK